MDATASATQISQLQVLQTSLQLAQVAVKDAAAQDQQSTQLITGAQAAPPPGVGTLIDIKA